MLIIIGDGIFDRTSNEKIFKTIWKILKDRGDVIHNAAGKAIEEVIRLVLIEKTLDNVTGVLLLFQNVDLYLKQTDSSSNYSNLQSDYDEKKEMPSPLIIEEENTKKNIENNENPLKLNKGNNQKHKKILHKKLLNIKTYQIPAIKKGKGNKLIL